MAYRPPGFQQYTPSISPHQQAQQNGLQTILQNWDGQQHGGGGGPEVDYRSVLFGVRAMPLAIGHSGLAVTGGMNLADFH